MKRAVVCVATTERYQRGAMRLMRTLEAQGESLEYWTWEASGWPMHDDKPYAFKAYALKAAADKGADLLLWADACILPVRSMEPLWAKIERDGYWICRNGWRNYDWCADSAYQDLLPEFGNGANYLIDEARNQNRAIPHVVATSFGLNVRSEIGKAFLDEYFRLASETRAFCGPWMNSVLHTGCTDSVSCQPCGPPDVLGHRHDQTAASVIAWRLGMKLTDAPEIFAYPSADGKIDERTILLADGSYA